MISEEDFSNSKILIIDDSELSITLLFDMFTRAGYQNITSTSDSTEGPDLYRKLKPDLVVLDLNMPKMNGFELMREFQKIEADNYSPVIVLSDQEGEEARFKALESGAKDFLKKPYDRIEVLKRIRNLIEVRLLHNQIRNQNKSLEIEVKERTKDLYDAQIDVIQRLARAIEFRDCETGMHIIRMSRYSECLAAKAGLDLKTCDMILLASTLHDIGKIGIPDSILRKSGKLTPEEWSIMKTHTTIGAELLSGDNSAFLNLASEIALTHHEKWDGSGYPKGLKGEEIPLVGRICCLADVFDALTTERPYKKSWNAEDAIEEIKQGSGTHFDPELVNLFSEILPHINQIREKYIDPKAYSATSADDLTR